jgi:hypothetical protein
MYSRAVVTYRVVALAPPTATRRLSRWDLNTSNLFARRRITAYLVASPYRYPQCTLCIDTQTVGRALVGDVQLYEYASRRNVADWASTSNA